MTKILGMSGKCEFCNLTHNISNDKFPFMWFIYKGMNFCCHHHLELWARQSVFQEIEKLKECGSTIAFHNCKKNPDDCMFHIDLEEMNYINLKCKMLGKE